ncbi:MAG: HvfC family RiPP maturation protein [Gammaproteobacteria bacterium]
MIPSADKYKPDSFQAVQLQFTRYIRDPDNAPAPDGIEERRLAIYRRLLYGNVDNFMSSHYPVIKKLLTDEQWETLLHDYFKTHHARTPLFPKMPQEFMQYLATPRPGINDIYPFLGELAHYEWVEAELSLDSREINQQGVAADGDLLEQVPVLNPLALPLQYTYPVHRIGPDYIPDAPPPQPSYLVVYRNRREEVKFLELNPVSARLIELIMTDSGHSGRRMLSQIAGELQHPEPELVISNGLDILQDMTEKDVILGTRV